jgi:hypothetical protein
MRQLLNETNVYNLIGLFYCSVNGPNITNQTLHIHFQIGLPIFGLFIHVSPFISTYNQMYFVLSMVGIQGKYDLCKILHFLV